jgi:plasmid stabilization system protein ParE
MRIRSTEPAVGDLEQICDYFEQHAGPCVAERIVRSIFDGIGKLADFLN